MGDNICLLLDHWSDWLSFVYSVFIGQPFCLQESFPSFFKWRLNLELFGIKHVLYTKWWPKCWHIWLKIWILSSWHSSSTCASCLPACTHSQILQQSHVLSMDHNTLKLSEQPKFIRIGMTADAAVNRNRRQSWENFLIASISSISRT